MRSPLTYWPCGGDVIGSGGQVIDRDEAHRLHLRHQQAASGDADNLAAELGHALAAADRWRRASVTVR